MSLANATNTAAGFLRQTKRGLVLYVKVVPTASFTAFDAAAPPAAVGENSEIKIRLQAPPVDGEANKRLVEFLSKSLGLPKSSFEIIKGATSTSKTILISNPKANLTNMRAILDACIH